VIGAFTRCHDKQFLFETAQTAGVACTPVNYPSDIVADPFLKQRDFFREVEHPRLNRNLDLFRPAVSLRGPPGRHLDGRC